MRWSKGDALWCVAGILIAIACSASGESKSSPGSGGSAASGGSGNAAGSGGTSGLGGNGGSGNIGIDASGGNDSAVDPDAPCQSVTQKASKPAVDVVWVIDNSCSMGDEIDKIRTNINASFVPIIAASNIDWQVIVVSAKGTSSQDVCFDPPLAGPACADNPPKFHQLDCTVGSTDSLTVIQQSYTVPNFFICAPGTQGWNTKARYDATKVFVEVTDDEAGPAPFFLNADMFDTWALTQAQPAGMFGTAQARKYIFHGIVGADPQNPTLACSSPTNSAEAPGIEYQKLAQLTGGTIRSICEDDWSDIFDTIASGIVNKLSCEYAVPAPGDGGAIDPDKVNVSFTPSGGSTDDILQDNNAPCDQGANGWQWDASKTKILLCGDWCDKVKADDGGQIDISFGCETKVVPPPT